MKLEDFSSISFCTKIANISSCSFVTNGFVTFFSSVHIYKWPELTSADVKDYPISDYSCLIK